MKGGIAAAAVAAMATGAQAALPHHRRAHELFRRGGEVCVPSCTTIWTTYYGEPTRKYLNISVLCHTYTD